MTEQRKGILRALLDAQREAGYVSPQTLDEIARQHGVTSNEAFGVASFYPQLYLFDRDDGHATGEPSDCDGEWATGEPPGSTAHGAETAAGFPVLGPEPRLAFPTRSAYDRTSDPADLETSAAGEGYTGWRRARELSPTEVREELARAGIVERSGPGVSLAERLATVAHSPGGDSSGDGSPGARASVVCNAGANDPADAVSSALLAHVPQRVVEGLLIAAYAAACGRAYLYIGGVPAPTVKGLLAAVVGAREGGLTGKGAAVEVEIEVIEALPALILAEETAVTAVLEGRRPMPDPPWSPRETPELFGEPCLVVDPETLANLPALLEHGADWYRAQTDAGRGTACYTVTGSVRRPAIVEVPLGTSLRRIIEGECGGVPEERALKAVQIGGSAGGWLTAADLDIPADREHLAVVGPLLGYGGLVVADDRSCMVDLARRALSLLEQESCGRCVVCREGTMQMAEIIADIATGEGKRDDIDLLHMLGETLASTGPCTWGRAAANPVLTSIRRFRDEYEVHIRDQQCPAGICGMAGSRRAQ